MPGRAPAARADGPAATDVPGRPGPVAGVDFRLLFEHASASFLVLDPDLVIVAASDDYLHDTMTERPGLLGKHTFDAFPDNPENPEPDSLAMARASFERVRRTLAPDTIPLLKYAIPRPAAGGGGFEERYWSVVNTPVCGPGGTLDYILHRVQDLTGYVLLRERGQARPGGTAARPGGMEDGSGARSREFEATDYALRGLVANFERQVEGAPEATLVVDRGGAIRMLNELAAAMFGYSRQELAGQPVEILVPEASRDLHVKHRADYAATPRMRTMGQGLDLRGQRRDGSLFPVDVALRTSALAGGLAVASIRDITSEKETAPSPRKRTRDDRTRQRTAPGRDPARRRRRRGHAADHGGTQAGKDQQQRPRGDRRGSRAGLPAQPAAP